MAEARRAVKLDPLSIFNRNQLGMALALARDWEGAVAEGEKALEMEPAEAFTWYLIGFARAMRGEYAAGVEGIHARAGQRDEATPPPTPCGPTRAGSRS